MNPLNELGGMLDEATRARMQEIEEEKKRTFKDLAVRQRLLAIDQAEEAARTPSASSANLERFGTTDDATIRARKAEGGIYEEPKTLALRMRTDQDALRGELEGQAQGVQAPASQEHLYEGVGQGGERYFTNKKALAHRGGATDVQPFEASGSGTFSNIGGGTSREQRQKDTATAALRRLNATPQEISSTDALRDFLKNRDYYRGLAEEVGATEAEEVMTADALEGKLPMHAVPHMSRMLGAESRLFLQDSSQGLPPTKEYATARRLAKEKLAQAEAAQHQADGINALKEMVEEQPGGTLKPAVDTARVLARGENAGEDGTDTLQQTFLATPTAPEGTPNVGATPSPLVSEVERTRRREEKRKKGRRDSEEALARRAREAGFTL